MEKIVKLGVNLMLRAVWKIGPGSWRMKIDFQELRIAMDTNHTSFKRLESGGWTSGSSGKKELIKNSW